MSLDCRAGTLRLEIGDDEMARRLAEVEPPAAVATSGYQKLYLDRVLQADEGCDFDFLVGCRGAAVPRHSH